MRLDDTALTPGRIDARAGLELGDGMKRLISGAEAAQAGLLGIAGWPVVAAMMPLSGDESGRYYLRRSLPGYRKACRMLRRSWRRVRCGFERRAWAKGSATPFRGMDALPEEMGAQAYLSVFDDPAAKAFAGRSVYDLGALRRQLDAGMLD